jgi:hypothetical protein
MLDLAQKGFTAQQVLNKLQYASGAREIKYRYDLLSNSDVKIGELYTVERGTISFSAAAQIKRTGSFNIKEYEHRDVDFLNDRIQPFFCLNMGGEWLEWPLGVFLISSPARAAMGKNISRRVTAYDMNLVLYQDRFTNRYLVRRGANYVNAVKQIMQGAGIVKINIRENAATLNSDREFEIGGSKITAVNELLKAINYTSCYVDGNGFLSSRPYVAPGDRGVDHKYADDALSVIGEHAEDELDLFDTPNYFVRTVVNPETQNIMTAKYINQDPASALSTVQRKRTIVDYAEISDISNQQTLQNYVYRIAFERSQIYNKVKISTAAMPHHAYSDTLYIKHSGLGIAGIYNETNWSLDLSEGGLMEHLVRKVVHV